MNILHLCLFVFLNLFSESLDEAVFLVETSEYDRKFIFGNNQAGASFYGNISYYYFSFPSLLAKKCTTIQYVQQFYDLVFGFAVEDYLLGKIDLRTRILWGNNQDALVDSYNIKFLGTEYKDHEHQINDKNFFWIREGWVDLDISRFMCLNRSINLVIGSMPYMLGRGISYGVVYAEVPGFIGADSGAVIEEFAPAILLSTEIYSNKNQTLFGDLYCGILTNWSGSYEQNIEPIYEKRIWHCPDESERGFGHINVALIAQLKYEASNKYGKLYVEPYVLCNLNPETNIILTRTNFADGFIEEVSASYLEGADIKSLSKSKLITFGCMVDWQSERFCFNLEFAVNKGGLQIFGRDLNTKKLDRQGSFDNGTLIVNNKVTEVDLGVGFSEAAANDINQPIIDSSPQGPQYNFYVLSFPPDPILINNFTRFKNPKKIDYQGAMGVFDFAYWCIPDEVVIATTIGFATGGDFELKIYNFIEQFLDSNILNLDAAGNYGGFISLQELYTGLWVQSAFGIGGPFRRPSVFSNYDYLNFKPTLFFKELFTDIKFIGLSLNLFPNFKSSLSLNLINYWSFCDPNLRLLSPCFFDNTGFGLLSCQLDNFLLSKDLGFEIFILGKYKFIENLEAFLGYAIFFPGERYYSEQIAAYDYYDAYYFAGYGENIDQLLDKTKFNPVYLFNVGFEYLF